MIHALAIGSMAMSAARTRVRADAKKAAAARPMDDVAVDLSSERSLTSSSLPELAISLSSSSSGRSGRSGSYASSASILHEPPRAPRPPRPPREQRLPDEGHDVDGVTMARDASAPPSIGLELGAPNRFATNVPTAPSTAETKRAVESSLRDPASPRAPEVGLGPEGPVMRALCDATVASTAPVRGRAVFRALADATGIVTGLDVVDCDGARSGWAHAAEVARAGLTGKKLRLPASTVLAELRVEITSTLKIPSGHDTGTNVSVFGVATGKGDGKQSSSVRVLDVLPHIRVVELSKELKVPIVTFDPDVIAISGDSVNAGAKPRRIVQAKLIHSKVM